MALQAAVLPRPSLRLMVLTRRRRECVSCKPPCHLSPLGESACQVVPAASAVPAAPAGLNPPPPPMLCYAGHMPCLPPPRLLLTFKSHLCCKSLCCRSVDTCVNL